MVGWLVVWLVGWLARHCTFPLSLPSGTKELKNTHTSGPRQVVIAHTDKAEREGMLLR
jgi:hypothetical protein